MSDNSLDLAIETWVFTKLSEDAEISAFVADHPEFSSLPGIYSDVAPENAAAPFIVFRIVSSVPEVKAQGTPIYWKVDVQVDLVSYGLTKKFSYPVFEKITQVLYQNQVDGTDELIAGCRLTQKLPTVVEILPGGKRKNRHIARFRLMAYSNVA